MLLGDKLSGNIVHERNCIQNGEDVALLKFEEDKNEYTTKQLWLFVLLQNRVC